MSPKKRKASDSPTSAPGIGPTRPCPSLQLLSNAAADKVARNEAYQLIRPNVMSLAGRQCLMRALKMPVGCSLLPTNAAEMKRIAYLIFQLSTADMQHVAKGMSLAVDLEKQDNRRFCDLFHAEYLSAVDWMQSIQNSSVRGIVDIIQTTVLGKSVSWGQAVVSFDWHHNASRLQQKNITNIRCVSGTAVSRTNLLQWTIGNAGELAFRYRSSHYCIPRASVVCYSAAERVAIGLCSYESVMLSPYFSYDRITYVHLLGPTPGYGENGYQLKARVTVDLGGYGVYLTAARKIVTTVLLPILGLESFLVFAQYLCEYPTLQAIMEKTCPRPLL